MSMTPEATRSFIECFNNNHPVGTQIIVIKNLGEQFQTKTRSPAQIANEVLPVIFVDGISGYYDLTRIIVVAK